MTFGYDPISRLASLADNLPGTTGDVTSTFAYNPASQVTAKSRSNNLYAFTGYVTLSRAYAANGLNQYTAAGSATFGYDSNGNLVSDGTSGFTYDAENRLVTTASGATLTYDPAGRLYAVASGGTTESYAYAGDQRIAEYTAVGMTARYVFGGGEDNPLIWYDGAATTAPRALQGDAQGSIVSVVDASGTILAYNSYDEYGIPGASNLGRFQYTGQVWLPQVGLYYYKARIYSPTLGRFLQTDPIGYADQMDLYSYVRNDPVDGSDPQGTEATTGGLSSSSTCGEFSVCNVAFFSDNNKGKASSPAGSTAASPTSTKGPDQIDDNPVGPTTLGGMSNILTNETNGLSGGKPGELEAAKVAEANAIYNGLHATKPPEVALPIIGKEAATSIGRSQDQRIARQVWTDRTFGRPDPVGGRQYIGTSKDVLTSRRIGIGRQTVFQRFGPFDHGKGVKQYIYIYNDPYIPK